MDAGQELRWPLDEIERRLRLAGNFHVAQEGWTSNCTCCGNSYVFTHAGTLQALGIPPGLIYGRPMSAGGIQVGRLRENYGNLFDLVFFLLAGLREWQRGYTFCAGSRFQVQQGCRLPVSRGR